MASSPSTIWIRSECFSLIILPHWEYCSEQYTAVSNKWHVMNIKWDIKWDINCLQFSGESEVGVLIAANNNEYDS